MLQKVQKNSASSTTSLDQKRHQREREISSLKPSFILLCKWYTWSGQSCRLVQLKKAKRKIGSCLISFTIGGMQPMAKCDGYQTTRQQNEKHNASFGDSSTNLIGSHPNSSKITFSAKLCLCICEFTSKKKRLSMLYLVEDWTDIPVTRSTLL